MTEHVVQLEGGSCFGATADENLLAAAQRAHWLVRYGCRNGNCRACAATLLAGSVREGDATIAATPDSAPSILLCLCHAQSDLRIELPGDPLHGSSEQARRFYSRVNYARLNYARVKYARVNYSRINNSGPDHSRIDSPTNHSGINDSPSDHSPSDHSPINYPLIDYPPINHSSINHSPINGARTNEAVDGVTDSSSSNFNRSSSSNINSSSGDSTAYSASASGDAVVELHLTLPAGRVPPVYPGQYFLLEHHGELLRAEVDTTVSSGRDIYLQCATATDFAADRYLTAIGPLGYCYAAAATVSVLIVRDTAYNAQARLLQAALPAACVCDAYDLGDHPAGAAFDIVLACTSDPQLAERWYGALLARGIAFDEFRSDTAIRYRWRVWRQDDNANRFAMDTGLSEAAARQLVEDYQRRGHKQLYWAEPMAPRDRR